MLTRCKRDVCINSHTGCISRVETSSTHASCYARKRSTFISPTFSYKALIVRTLPVGLNSEPVGCKRRGSLCALFSRLIRRSLMSNINVRSNFFGTTAGEWRPLVSRYAGLCDASLEEIVATLRAYTSRVCSTCHLVLRSSANVSPNARMRLPHCSATQFS